MGFICIIVTRIERGHQRLPIAHKKTFAGVYAQYLKREKQPRKGG
jgi:hypothetical protein